MASFGGEMRFTYNGAPLVLRAAIKTTPSNTEVEGIVNQDNSVSASHKPSGYGFEPTFEDAADVDWDAVMRNGPYNISCVEDHTGVVHTWTGAIFTGRPSVDRGTGEVTGIQGLARAYRKSRG